MAAALVLAVLVSPGCRPPRSGEPVSAAVPGKPDPAGPSAGAVSQVTYTPDEIARNNRGVALLGQFQYKDAAELFAELVRQRPTWVEARVNLALAYLNLDQTGKRAQSLLEEVLQLQPDHVAANYCLGVILVFEGHAAEARSFVEKVYSIDSQDPYVMHLLGKCSEAQSADEALRWYQKSIERDATMVSSYFRCFEILRIARRLPEAMPYKEKFEQLKACAWAHTFEYKYTLMGPKALAIAVDLPAEPAAVPAGPVFEPASPIVKSGPPLSAPPTAPLSVTACDVNGDGRVDLFIAGAASTAAGPGNTVILHEQDGSFRVATDHPLAAVPDVQAAVWGDLDNDGLTDVYLCRRGPNQLWRQKEPGLWEDVTKTSKTDGGNFTTVDASAWDADHDGDLDLLLVRADGPIELLNNNRDGTFQPIAADAKIVGDGSPARGLILADIDHDLDYDLVVLKKNAPHEVYRNRLLWKFEPAGELAEFCKSDVVAAVSGDVDADGRAEIYALGRDGLTRWSTGATGPWRREVLDAGLQASGEAARLAIADVNGDGRLDLMAGQDTWRAIDVSAKSTAPLFAAEVGSLASWTVAVLDADRGPSVVGVARDKPAVAWRPGPGRHPFVSLFLAGAIRGGNRQRSNTSGLGARADLRCGSRWTRLDPVRNVSGAGQSLQPAAAGLGSQPKADFVRIVWPDGVPQVEMDVAAGAHRIEEMDRMPSSCPILFAWDGRKYAFVSDLLGVGGLGYLVVPGQYATPDPTENFLLPAERMVPRGNRFAIKLTEPMEELTYLDQISLVAYDAPRGWQMALDERLAVNPPHPTGQPIFYRTCRLPGRATNERGEDVTAQVQKADGRAAPVGEEDSRFIGKLAGEHILTLGFDQPLEQLGRDVALLAEGWVEFPFSQTAFAAWQAKEKFTAPTIEAWGEDGQWHVVRREFGYPGGMSRQISISLPGLPARTTRLRLRTNQEIYWDRLMVVGVEPCPAARRQVLKMEVAEVRECGFMPRVLLDQRRASFDYDQRSPAADRRAPAGFYTALGPATDLVRAEDGALAVFGPGEELHLEFAVPTDDGPPGWRRYYVLETVGWCKDMDFYTADGGTVDPLPRAGASIPLNDRYNTRYRASASWQPTERDADTTLR